MKLIVAPDAAQEPLMDRQPSTGQHFQTGPRWLVYHDLVTSSRTCVGYFQPD